jgi:hypothetical protein
MITSTQQSGDWWLTLKSQLLRDREDHGSRSVQAKNSQDFNSTNSWAHWCLSVIPVTVGSINRRIVVQPHPGKKQNPISKITRIKRHVTSNTAPA